MHPDTGRPFFEAAIVIEQWGMGAYVVRSMLNERESEEGVGGDFGCVRFGRFTRRKRHSIFLPCTVSDEDRNEAYSARAPKPNATPLKRIARYVCSG